MEMASIDVVLVRPSIWRAAIFAVLSVAPLSIFALVATFIMPIRFADGTTGWLAVSACGVFIVLAIAFFALQLRMILAFEVTEDGISRRGLSVIFLNRKWNEIGAISRFRFLWLLHRKAPSAIGATTFAVSRGAFIPAPVLLDDATLAQFHAAVIRYAPQGHPLAERLSATDRLQVAST